MTPYEQGFLDALLKVEQEVMKSRGIVITAEYVCVLLDKIAEEQENAE